MGTRVLLVDDEPTNRAALHRLIAALGHEVVVALDGADGIAKLRSQQVDLCVTDLRMRQTDGFAVLEAARKYAPSVPVVVLAGQGNAREAVAALRAGAIDFIPKPFHSTVLNDVIGRALDDRWGAAPGRRTGGAAVIGEHPAMRLVLDRIEQVAETDANVLILGETGTGKEVVARLIHAASARRAGPFVTVSLANLTEAQAELVLFGNSEDPASGRMATAQHGTLFLDEIGELPKELQTRLLNVLRERSLPQPNGSAVTFDIRVIAASNRLVEQMAREGTFLEELYYRLNVIPIQVPPLRERREDISLLSEHFRRRSNAREERNVPPFSRDIVDRLCAYDWPGNVRQLQSTVERLVSTAGHREVTVGDLPANLRTDVIDLGANIMDLPPYGLDLRLLLTQLEDRLIGQALQRTNGNKNRAAELLGMNRTTLVEKLRRRNVA